MAEGQGTPRNRGKEPGARGKAGNQMANATKAQADQAHTDWMFTHLPTCSVGAADDLGGDCCCYEAKQQTPSPFLPETTTKAETAERIAELKEFIYNTGVSLQRVSRAMIDEDTIAEVLQAANGFSSEVEAHQKRRAELEGDREALIVDLTEAHRDLEALTPENI